MRRNPFQSYPYRQGRNQSYGDNAQLLPPRPSFIKTDKTWYENVVDVPQPAKDQDVENRGYDYRL